MREPLSGRFATSNAAFQLESAPSLIRGNGKAFKENSKAKKFLIIENFLRQASEADSGARWLSCECHQGSGDCHLHSSAFPAVESQLSRAMMRMESVRLRSVEFGPSFGHADFEVRLWFIGWADFPRKQQLSPTRVARKLWHGNLKQLCKLIVS